MTTKFEELVCANYMLFFFHFWYIAELKKDEHCWTLTGKVNASISNDQSKLAKKGLYNQM